MTMQSSPSLQLFLPICSLLPSPISRQSASLWQEGVQKRHVESTRVSEAADRLGEGPLFMWPSALQDEQAA